MAAAKLAFMHLETDAEFIERIAPLLNGWARNYLARLTGEELDVYAWDCVKLQRKLIEVYP